MYLPVIHGVIARRILVNYRVQPKALAQILPVPFRPQLVQGYGIAGICLIRLAQIRPRMWPASLGFASENAAHRIAVEWDEHGELRRGVYIPRRDTSSRLNVCLGGRLFPGIHHLADFSTMEVQDRYHVEFNSRDDATHILVEGRPAASLPGTSVFKSAEEASNFFAAGSLGFSPAHTANEYEGLELRTLDWELIPLVIDQLESSFFDDSAVFPPDTVQFDSAFLMQQIRHEWHVRSRMKPVVPMSGSVN